VVELAKPLEDVPGIVARAAVRIAVHVFPLRARCRARPLTQIFAIIRHRHWSCCWRV
jgi:hypothetical protein